MKAKIYLVYILMMLSFNLAEGQSVGLVLSGGGAKGISHVGVIKALEEYNIPIDYICGTSMGAIIGGLYAAGYTTGQMLEMLKSPEFEAWYRGEPEPGYATSFYRDEADAAMFSFAITRKKGDGKGWSDPFELEKRPGLKIDFPTSIVSPYSMDFALIEVFAPASVAAADDFNNLMIPFFCVAADIKGKRPLVMKSGSLGSAVRASMTYPFVFRPITVDSILLFDGGFYNNFPWKIMERDYSPEFLIGAKCVTGDTSIDEDDIVTHVTNMLMSGTDYVIPEDKGIVIERKYPYGLMDFHRADEIVEMGYKNALLYIEKIKDRVKREKSADEVDSMRMAFRGRERELVFGNEIEISGPVNGAGKEFIANIMRGKGEKVQNSGDMKRNYYRLAATNRFKTLYPSYKIEGDSILTLTMRATRAAAWSVSIGGNISSSSLNQGFLGATYSHLSGRPWKIGAGLNVGKYYKGGYLLWRHDLGTDPMIYYRVEGVVHQFDYYNGNQNLFVPDKLPGNIRQLEYYGRAEVVVPACAERNIFLKAGVVAGEEYYKYYQSNKYRSSDVADKTFLTLLSPMVGLERNTLDSPVYPLSGRRQELLLRYNYALERFETGTVAPAVTGIYRDRSHSKYIFRAKSEAFFKISERLVLGYIADLVISNRNSLVNYISTILYMPVFRAVSHNGTTMMEGYRADSYIGVGFSPVILFSNSLFLHCNLSWFQPYENIVESDDGKYHYSGPFPKGALLGNAALVWRSPIGPVSLSATYYEKGANKWYTQLNIGFLVFKKRALDF